MRPVSHKDSVDGSNGPLDNLSETQTEGFRGFIEEFIMGISRLLYYLGARLLLKANRCKRKAKKILGFAGGKIYDQLSAVGSRISRSLARSLLDFLDIFRRANYRYQKSKKRVSKRWGDSILASVIIGLYAAWDLFKLLIRLLLMSVNYIAPVAAAAFLIFTWNFFTNISYGLEVQLNGQTLGYIMNEGTYESAEQEMQRRIYYQEGDEPLTTTPSFSLAVVSTDEMLSYERLCDQMILSSDNDISLAAGLIINGNFLGATTEPEKLGTVLDGVLEQYRTGAEGEKVDFKDDVRMTTGYYLTGSIVDVQALVELVTGEEEGRQEYVVVEGDTPSGVAQKLGVPYSEFLALNPTAEDEFFVGTVLLVKNSKPSLSVQVTRTEVSTKDLDYEIIVTRDSSRYTTDKTVTQNGQKGTAEYTDEVVYVDGIEVQRTNVERVVLEKPVDQKETHGTKSLPTTGSVNASSAAIAATAPSGSYQWPVQSGGRVTMPFQGYYGHSGIDIQSSYGDGTLAADSGIVTLVQYLNYGYGYQVVVDHGNGVKTRYAHNSEILVTLGQEVAKGQVIARQGATGNVTGVHLHFEIIINGVPINPYPYIA